MELANLSITSTGQHSPIVSIRTIVPNVPIVRIVIMACKRDSVAVSTYVNYLIDDAGQQRPAVRKRLFDERAELVLMAGISLFDAQSRDGGLVDHRQAVDEICVKVVGTLVAPPAGVEPDLQRGRSRGPR